MNQAESRAAEKAAARERFRRVRTALPASVRAAESAAAVRGVLALPEVEAARVVHVFWPVLDRAEVDVRPLIVTLADWGVTVALPAVAPGPVPHLVHRRFGGEAALVSGPWGLREPPASAPVVVPEAADVVVVPGLAMGRDGSRLGYGGGYYDRFLTEATGALRVGVVWAACLVDALPTEPHDARLDVVVAGPEAVRTGRERRNPSGPRA